MYRTLNSTIQIQIDIKNSKFIAHGKPVENENQAKEFIEFVRGKHDDASHNVYAYIILNEPEIQRYSDDGEPAGTAGIPVLELIKKELLKNVVIVVTRYFGGTLLGTGGLIRAYRKSAAMAISKSGTINKELCARIEITVDYPVSGKVNICLENFPCIIVETVYTHNVLFKTFVKKSHMEKLQKAIEGYTSGRAIFKVTGFEYAALER